MYVTIVRLVQWVPALEIGATPEPATGSPVTTISNTEAISTASHKIFTATVTVTIARSLYLWRRTNSKEGVQSAIHSLPEINLNINFKAQNRKTKTDTNPIPDPNWYRRRCPDPNARIQKFYTLYLGLLMIKDFFDD